MALNVFLGRTTHWPDVSNWSLGAIPIDAHDVLIPDTTQTPLLTGLDRTGDGANGLDLKSFYVDQGYHADIGSLGHPLKCTVDNGGSITPSLLHQGSGTLHFDSQKGGAGANTTKMVVCNSRNLSETRPAMVISGGTSIGTIGLSGGHLHLSAGYTAVAVNNVFMAQDGGRQAMLTVSANIQFLRFADGVVNVTTSPSAVVMSGGVYVQIAGATSSLYLSGGLVLWNTSTGLASLYLQGGTVDTTRTAVPKVITNLYKWPTGILLRSPQLTVTNEYKPFGLDTD